MSSSFPNGAVPKGDEVFRFGAEAIQEGLERANRSALVRFFWDTPKPRMLVQKVLNNLWKCDESIQVIEVGFKLLQVVFPTVEMKDNKIKEGPWYVHRDIFNMVSFSTPSEKIFNQLQFTLFWVKLDNVPSHCITERFGKDFLAYYGEVKDVSLFRALGTIAVFIKGLVKIDLLSPFFGRRKACGDDGKEFWVIQQYEGLRTICFICGRVAHTTSRCPDTETSPDWVGRGTWMFIQKDIGFRVEGSTLQKKNFNGNVNEPSLPPYLNFEFATMERKNNFNISKPPTGKKGFPKDTELLKGAIQEVESSSMELKKVEEMKRKQKREPGIAKIMDTELLKGAIQEVGNITMEMEKVEEMRRKHKREAMIAKNMDTSNGGVVDSQVLELGKTIGEKNEKKKQDFSKLRQQDFCKKKEVQRTHLASEGYNREKHYLRGQLGAGKARSQNGYFYSSGHGERSTNKLPFGGRVTNSKIWKRNDDGTDQLNAKRKLFSEEKGKNKASSNHGVKKKNHPLLQKGIKIKEPLLPVPDSIFSSDESQMPLLPRKSFFVGSPSSRRRAGKQEGREHRAQSEGVIPKKRPHDFFGKPSKSLELISNMYGADDDDHANSEEEYGDSKEVVWDEQVVDSSNFAESENSTEQALKRRNTFFGWMKPLSGYWGDVSDDAGSEIFIDPELEDDSRIWRVEEERLNRMAMEELDGIEGIGDDVNLLGFEPTQSNEMEQEEIKQDEGADVDSE
ncbi:hypothetical protein LINPERPRIM_LOCUS4432 [Linum perenne]